ncbi:alkaline phosphatase family protein [Bacteroidales bacterium OttesenSCG-928-J19]|nr:alkaline phosphatase family protein [Bacteroidales bacterium OttesenSCG-928-J19]
MNKVLSSLIALLAVTGIHAQHTGEVPKLVVSIVVDQLRGDYLEYFSSTFGEKGFNRLKNEGLVYHQIDYGFQNMNEASAVASLYTGTYPYYHGIIGDKYYDPQSRQEVPIVYDPAYLGNYTNDKFSPRALLSTTLGDEIKRATNGQSRVYSIAPNATTALVSAGRYANAAFWLDNHNGRWATSTYYKDFPSFVDRFNATKAIGDSSDKTWIQSLSYFPGFPYSETRSYFKYTFSKGDLDRISKIKQTALINEQVTELALRFVENVGFERQNEPDLLALTYYAGNFSYADYTDEYNYEIQDTYHQLDKQLEKLLTAIEKKVGLKNVLIVLTSTGYFDAWSSAEEPFSPFGEFFPARCTALLNMYLMATYGQGDWVSHYYNNQIYLNKKLVEDSNLNWLKFLADAAGFVAQFSGVQEVTTLGQWLFDDTGRSSGFRRGMNKKTSGHLFVELQPGWVLATEGIKTSKQFERNTAVLTRAIFFGGNIKKQDVYRPIKATEITPSISHVLRIRPPNASRDLPLQEFLK